jgi:hypothetical protein
VEVGVGCAFDEVHQRGHGDEGEELQDKTHEEVIFRTLQHLSEGSCGTFHRWEPENASDAKEPKNPELAEIDISAISIIFFGIFSSLW